MLSLNEYFSKYGNVQFPFVNIFNPDNNHDIVHFNFDSVDDIVTEILRIDKNVLAFYYRVDDRIRENFNHYYHKFLFRKLNTLKIPDSKGIGDEILEKYFIKMRSKFVSSFIRTGFTAGANAVPALTSTLMQNSMSSAKKSGSAESLDQKSDMAAFDEILKSVKTPRDSVVEANFNSPKSVEDVFELRAIYNHVTLGDLSGKDEFVEFVTLDVIRNYSWINKYEEMNDFSINFENRENLLMLNLDRQLMYNYNMSPFRIVKIIEENGRLESSKIFAKLIPSYFHEAKILVVPDSGHDSDKEVIGKLIPNIGDVYVSGIPYIKQTFPLVQNIWQTLNSFEKKDHETYVTTKAKLSKNMNIGNESYLNLFEYVGFRDIEFEGKKITFKSDHNPSEVRDTYEKYYVKRDLNDRILLLFEEPRLEYDGVTYFVKYDKTSADIMGITNEEIIDFMREKGAKNVVMIDGGGIEYENEIDLEEFIVIDKLNMPSEYEKKSNFIYLRADIKYKDSRKSTEQTIYGLLQRPEIYKYNIWSDNNHDIKDVFGIEVAEANVVNTIQRIQSSGGKLPFHRRYIDDVLVKFMTKDGDLRTFEFRASVNVREHSAIAAATMADPGKNMSLSAVFGTYESGSTHVNVSALTGGLPIIGSVAEKFEKGEAIDYDLIKINEDTIKRLRENPSEWEYDNADDIMAQEILKYSPDPNDVIFEFSTYKNESDDYNKPDKIIPKNNRRRFKRKTVERSKPEFAKIVDNPYDIPSMEINFNPPSKMPDLY